MNLYSPQTSKIYCSVLSLVPTPVYTSMLCLSSIINPKFLCLRLNNSIKQQKQKEGKTIAPKGIAAGEMDERGIGGVALDREGKVVVAEDGLVDGVDLAAINERFT